MYVGRQPEFAKSSYYYDEPRVPAVDTVRRHIAEVERVVLEGERLFGGGREIEA